MTMLVPKVVVVVFAITSYVIGALSKNVCTKPSVRREWRAFSAQEKAAWIRAVDCLSHLPHDPALTATVDPSISQIPPINASGSYYDDIVYTHMDLNIRIHFTGLFLPWHRWYVYLFENALKSKCGYTGVSPYWNWTIDAPDYFESSFWKDSDPQSGLGGWGNPKADYSVPDGGFRNLHLSYPSPHTVRRDFTLQPFGDLPLKEANSSFLAPEIEKLLETPAGDYKSFQAAFEAFGGAHSSVHLIVGGDLGGTCPNNAPSNCIPGPTWSPNDPLFWMHHAMVDKVWYDWQHRNPESAKSFFGGSVQALQNLDSHNQYPNGGPPFLNLSSTMPADGLSSEVTIGDVMNTTSGILCYIYE
ncbi:Di-copper centre-containing protein [Lactarius akahatsu]|uniref:Di-copper centre-containing protein n=1 Tax=Lactarius akahatsu TaxID=416441 RepID=A0AAD4Q7J0_9AGAM|nr:Di-copper centre-containing protein [Lactarius akahatsu]